MQLHPLVKDYTDHSLLHPTRIVDVTQLVVESLHHGNYRRTIIRINRLTRIPYPMRLTKPKPILLFITRSLRRIPQRNKLTHKPSTSFIENVIQNTQLSISPTTQISHENHTFHYSVTTTLHRAAKLTIFDYYTGNGPRPRPTNQGRGRGPLL